MKALGEERRHSSYSFLTSALVKGHAPAALNPRSHWMGGCVILRIRLDAKARRKILCRCRESNRGHPVRRYADLATPAPPKKSIKADTEKAKGVSVFHTGIELMSAVDETDATSAWSSCLPRLEYKAFRIPETLHWVSPLKEHAPYSPTCNISTPFPSTNWLITISPPTIT
jgi:hypothetical protein